MKKNWDDSCNRQFEWNLIKIDNTKITQNINRMAPE